MFIDNELPEYISKTQSSKFLLATYRENKPSILGFPPNLGVRCNLPILIAEYYVSNREPVIEPCKGPRLIVWHRQEGVEKPVGWRTLFANIRYTAIAIVDLTKNQGKFFKDWSGSAKTSRNKWHKQSQYIIQVSNQEKFLLEYAKSIVVKHMRNFFVKQLESFVDVYKDDVHFLLVEDVVSKKVIYGFCYVHDRETNQSLHLIAFRSGEHISRDVGVGVIEYWMDKCIQDGIRYANLGVVWQKGDPSAWKGYSQFKMHFKPVILRYQKPLFKMFWK